MKIVLSLFRHTYTIENILFLFGGDTQNLLMTFFETVCCLMRFQNETEWKIPSLLIMLPFGGLVLLLQTGQLYVAIIPVPGLWLDPQRIGIPRVSQE